jgi:hypothetical protein
VILLDLALPTASGFDVLETLKSSPATVNIPVVVISAYVMLVENCVSRGASACVQKPFDIDDLVMQVRQALKMAVDQQALKVPTYAETRRRLDSRSVAGPSHSVEPRIPWEAAPGCLPRFGNCWNKSLHTAASEARSFTQSHGQFGRRLVPAGMVLLVGRAFRRPQLQRLVSHLTAELLWRSRIR